MFNFKTIALVSLLALAVPGLAPAADQAKPTYAQIHKGALGMFTSFRSELSNAENSARLHQLPIELGKLAGFEKAYGEAKAAGKEDEAKAAAASYTTTAQAVIDLALPLDALVQEGTSELNSAFQEVGPQIVKVLKEADVAAAQAEITTMLKPLGEANKKVGLLHHNAVAAAEVRARLEKDRILSEEFNHQVTNYLQGKLGQ